jgi:glycosyltransferase involved in cell wall biosynthesis
MAQAVKQIELTETGRAAEIAPDVSVVVPVAERADDLVEIYRTHAAVLVRRGVRYEFVVVADSGFEHAVRPLVELARRDAEPIRVLVLPRRFGEATALSVGFREARGEIVVTLPAYFQTEPHGLDAVLDALERGDDLVVGRRWPRTDPWVNRAQNAAFHAITRRSTGVPLHDVSCGLKAMRRGVTREVRPYGDLHRFLPLLAVQRGFRVSEVDVPQHPADRRTRVHAPGIYLRRVLDLFTLFFLTKFVRKPLRFFGLIGAGLFGSGFLICLALAIYKFAAGAPLVDRPLLILGVLLMVLGVQVGSIGLLGEIVIFTHSRRMRDYTIREVRR